MSNVSALLKLDSSVLSRLAIIQQRTGAQDMGKVIESLLNSQQNIVDLAMQRHISAELAQLEMESLYARACNIAERGNVLAEIILGPDNVILEVGNAFTLLSLQEIRARAAGQAVLPTIVSS